MSPHAYRDLSREEIENVFSYYLINSWSFSKVNAFARNEKAFEMNYVYCYPSKMSASSIAGEAYHKALDFYFSELKDGVKSDLVSLQIKAFEYISEVKPQKWKTQKTTPSIEDCIKKANSTVVALLKNFLSEVSVYEADMKEILGVELYCDEFLTINGVDIPLPCHMKIDLVIRTNDDKLVIIDHKSKSTFSDEEELRFSIGKQAITYALGYEASHDITVDEVWFIENKYSENKDKSAQVVPFKVKLDKNTSRLYEALLYEPLKRMLEAVSNPDYVYIINENDNFIDQAELYEFWARTMIGEISDYPVPESKADLIKKRLLKIRDASLASIDPKIIREFKDRASEFITYDLTNKNMSSAEKIEHTLKTLNISVKVAHTLSGYSSDTFLLKMSAGTTINSIFKYKLDIANALNVETVRMGKNLCVYEGESYVSVEAAKQRESNLLFDEKYMSGLKIPLGLDNFGNLIQWDMENQSTPHVLIGGSTGSGKSVCIRSILEYALRIGMDEVVILDPKYEFVKYRQRGVTVLNDIEKIESKMAELVIKMNRLVEDGETQRTLVIFDEFADAVAQSAKGEALNIYTKYMEGKKIKKELVGVKKSLEENLKMLLQKGRSSGFRIIAATQRASVEVITGDAKVNFPVQICFRMPKEIDSKVMIDEPGAESLSGNGDGLIKSPEYNSVVRFQGFFKD